MKKIDFTCRKVTLKDMVQCNYDLNESEYNVFSNIMQTKRGLSVKELVKKIKKDRTTVQKILVKLLRKDLIYKRQKNLERGFMFVYFSKDKKIVFDEIEENVNKYFKNLKDSLDAWKKQL